MKTKEIIKRARELAKPFRISKGKDFRLKDVDPRDTLDFTKEEDKPKAKEALIDGRRSLGGLARQTLRAGQVGGAADLSSDGRGWKGRRHQARDVWHKSAGLPGIFVQISLERGSRS